MFIIKRDGYKEKANPLKIKEAIKKAFKALGYVIDEDLYNDITDKVKLWDGITINEIQEEVIEVLRSYGYDEVADAYLIYKVEHDAARKEAGENELFIERYKQSNNTANATIDDNSNVGGKNIAIINAEIHKGNNKLTSRVMLTNKLRKLFPDFYSKNYVKDLESHIIYKHDETTFSGPIAPYCCSISLYPFLRDGLKHLEGLSARPKNLDSFCGMFINLIFAVSGQFAGAVAVSEFFVLFDYFARKKWGDQYYQKPDIITTSSHVLKQSTIRKDIHQYFQQVIYSINQPAAARGMQSAFVNFSYFDKEFFEAMFGNFLIPTDFDADGTPTGFDTPRWESINWLQKEYITWFNNERLKEVITFPVESFALIYKDGEFADKENADFVAEAYSKGHSFFTYISDTADSLSSCCRLKNKIQTNEFSFTNGNMGVETGSKSVITLNLNRIIQNWAREYGFKTWGELEKDSFKNYLRTILQRVYKYQIAYNECLWDMYNAGLLPVYTAGFISLDRQYLTIGINGLNESAKFLGFSCTPNDDYKEYCEFIFGSIKESNQENNGTYFGHKVQFNTECVPAEGLGPKNYAWDKADHYWVPEDRELYASYIYEPSNAALNPFDKMIMHGRDYIGDYLDGGSAAHINLSEHLSFEQNKQLLKFAAENGCQYFTYNVPNCKCEKCGFITKSPIEKCPKCGSTKVVWYDRIIGYLTKMTNWSKARFNEARHYYGVNGFDRKNGKIISKPNKV